MPCSRFDFRARARTKILHERRCESKSPLVLLVRDMLHPLNHFAVQLFLQGNVRHRGGGGRAMPMLFVGRKPDHVTGVNLFHRAAFVLCPPQPEMTINVWPKGCVCHAVRAPGSKVTLAP